MAIVGCGAIARRRHIPAILRHPEVELVALVDRDRERAHSLRTSYGLTSELITDYSSLTRDRADAVINALPTHLHTPANLVLLRNGMHTLCEKPLALTAADAARCFELAAENSVVLAAALHWRFYRGMRLMSLALEDGLLGKIDRYDWQYGLPYDWPAFDLSRSHPGGGILFDQGIYLIDALLHWFGPITEFHVTTDDWGGGFDANALLDLQHHGPCGVVRGQIRLSHTHTLKNRLLVVGADSKAQITRGDPEHLIVDRDVSHRHLQMSLAFPDDASAGDAFAQQLDHFVNVVRGARQPQVAPADAVAAIDIIERSYQRARRLDEPWANWPPPSEPHP